MGPIDGTCSGSAMLWCEHLSPSLHFSVRPVIVIGAIAELAGVVDVKFQEQAAPVTNMGPYTLESRILGVMNKLCGCYYC